MWVKLPNSSTIFGTHGPVEVLEPQTITPSVEHFMALGDGTSQVREWSTGEPRPATMESTDAVD